MYEKTRQKIKEQCGSVYPGAVFCFIDGQEEEVQAIGNAQIEPSIESMTEEALFDVASLTKVVCTTTVMLKLYESGRITWDQPLHDLLPEFQNETITLRHLLTHTSDIKTYIPNRDQLDAKELRKAYLGLQPGENLGKVVQYTDAGTILLGFMIEELYQKDVVEVFKEEVLEPLAMTDSLFLPKAPFDEIVPTQRQADGTILKGATHDPKARVLARHAGNAGLFTSIRDLRKFAKMYLNLGRESDMIYLNDKTIHSLLHDQTPDKKGNRSIGWDLKESLTDQHPLLFHTGYTGTFLLLDVTEHAAFIFLSNRVHPLDHRESYILKRDELIHCYLKERAQIEKR